jgi:hypothetical protein
VADILEPVALMRPDIVGLADRPKLVPVVIDMDPFRLAGGPAGKIMCDGATTNDSLLWWIVMLGGRVFVSGVLRPGLSGIGAFIGTWLARLVALAPDCRPSMLSNGYCPSLFCCS